MLESIFKIHLSWQKMKTVQTEGSEWPLMKLNNSKQLKDIDNALKFGNHKGANQQQELPLKLVKDYLVRGFALPLPLNKIKKNPGILPPPSQHPAPEEDQQTRGNHPKKQTHSQPKLEMAIGQIHQQQSWQNKVNALLLWKSPEAAH